MHWRMVLENNLVMMKMPLLGVLLIIPLDVESHEFLSKRWR
jgi:hypothetical protein